MKYVVLGLALCLGIAVQSQEPGGLSGTVIDAEMHGEPLLMAHVALGETEASTLTNFHGNFEFTNLQPGEYTLHISFLGYEDLEMPITVKSGERLEIVQALAAKTLALDAAPILTSNADTEARPSPSSSFKP